MFDFFFKRKKIHTEPVEFIGLDQWYDPSTFTQYIEDGAYLGPCYFNFIFLSPWEHFLIQKRVDNGITPYVSQEAYIINVIYRKIPYYGIYKQELPSLYEELLVLGPLFFKCMFFVHITLPLTILKYFIEIVFAFMYPVITLKFTTLFSEWKKIYGHYALQIVQFYLTYFSPGPTVIVLNWNKDYQLLGMTGGRIHSDTVKGKKRPPADTDLDNDGIKKEVDSPVTQPDTPPPLSLEEMKEILMSQQFIDAEDLDEKKKPLVFTYDISSIRIRIPSFIEYWFKDYFPRMFFDQKCQDKIALRYIKFTNLWAGKPIDYENLTIDTIDMEDFYTRPLEYDNLKNWIFPYTDKYLADPYTTCKSGTGEKLWRMETFFNADVYKKLDYQTMEYIYYNSFKPSVLAVPFMMYVYYIYFFIVFYFFDSICAQPDLVGWKKLYHLVFLWLYIGYAIVFWPCVLVIWGLNSPEFYNESLFSSQNPLGHYAVAQYELPWVEFTDPAPHETFWDEYIEDVAEDRVYTKPDWCEVLAY